LTFYVSVQWSGIAVATLTFATFPLAILLIESLLARRPPHAVDVGAGLVIIFAVTLLVGVAVPHTERAELGAVNGLLSALTFAAFSVGSQHLGKSINALPLSLFQSLAVVLFTALFLPLSPRAPHGSDWLWLAALGILATALMHQLYFYGLKHLPASACG